MKGKPQPFRNADEKDELRWEIERLITLGRRLEKLRANPAYAAYLLAPVDKAVPLLPTQDEMTAARAVMERAATCLLHHYHLRRRWDGDELTIEPERSPTDQDNDTPF